MSIAATIQNFFHSTPDKPHQSDLSRQIRAEIAEVRTRSISYGNSTTRFAIAMMDSEVASAIGYIETQFQREVNRIKRLGVNVSYGISFGKHGETVCDIHVSDRQHHIYDDKMYWYVFRNPDGKLEQMVSRHNLLGDNNLPMSECSQILYKLFDQQSTTTMSVEMYNIIDDMIDDIKAALKPKGK